MTRKAITSFGERGQGKVTVYDEPDRSRFVVELFDDGKPRREVFSYSGGASKVAAKAEAKATAKAAHTDREAQRLRGDLPETMTALYAKYVTAMEGGWRPATRTGNSYRWRMWQLFAGAETDPNAVTEDDLDLFVKRLRGNQTAPNQIKAAVALVRAVYRLALRRAWVTCSAPVTYELRMAKNEVAQERAEYHPDEWKKLVAACRPSESNQWRIYVTLLLQGSQGQRIASVRQLQWADVTADTITWAGDRRKQGTPFTQPLTATAKMALEVAASWRAAEGYTGPWVLYAPGRTGGRGGRNERGWGKGPTEYQTLHSALMQAERRAGVVHLKGRSTHGNRKMAAGNVYDGTGHNLMAAAEWIGDKDTKTVEKYLKRIDDRLTNAAAAAEKGAEIGPDHTPDHTSEATDPAQVASTLEPLVRFELTTASIYRNPEQPETAAERAPDGVEIPPNTPEPRPNPPTDHTHDHTRDAEAQS